MADMHHENEEMEQCMHNGEEDHPLERGEGHQPTGNNRQRRARQLASNFQWAIPNQQVNDGMGGDGDDMEMSTEEMREIGESLGSCSCGFVCVSL